jgi:NAD(P)-dependent dehydrogenase (short-subunit alcohol dehydrogenase family)
MVDKQLAIKKFISMFSLKDRNIIVTGASGLLGREHVNAILGAGGTPILLDLNQEVLDKQVLELKKLYDQHISAYAVDITNEEQVKENCEKIILKYGKIDGLVNNAANNPKVENSSEINFSRLENFPINVWNKDLDVALTGTFLCTKYYGFEISKNPNGGSIVNISSDLGLIAPDQRLYRIKGLKESLQPVKPITYSVVKTGIIGLTRYVSTYWAEKNVRCNAICPGGVENNQNQEFVDELIKRIPMKRMAKQDEYQGILVFLLSKASSYINGSIISADGGRTAW